GARFRNRCPNRPRPIRAAARVPARGLPPDAQAHSFRRQVARRPRAARRELAFHSRRFRFLLKLVFVTQELDPEHPALAATSSQVAALARKVDELVVFAASVVPDGLPANVRARTFGAGSRAGRGARFEAALARELSGLDLVVAH